ncbi:MAG: hypothetical protein K0B05_09780 [Bacteroidales bacterium]|nr:hypothetical protein [Bacteroidales bacterium]
MKKITILSLIVFASFVTSVAQVAVGYNTDGNTLTLSTNPENRLWGEFRVNTKAYNHAGWSYNDRGITQVYLLTPLFQAKGVTLYAGGGLGVNLLSKDENKWVSINIPAGLKTNPFDKLPGLYLFGEYDPMIVVAEGVPVIHCLSAGFRVVLRK